MKVISLVGFKGGCTKTTNIMALASAVIANGKKCLIIDADSTPQISKWQESFEANDFEAFETPDWPKEQLKIEIGESANQVYKVASRCEKDGFDYCLIDTGGGASDFTTDLITMAGMVIVPLQPSPNDLDLALETVDWLEEIKSDNDLDFELRAMLGCVPAVAKRSRSVSGIVEGIVELPMTLKTMIPDNDVFTNIKTTGPIGTVASEFKKLSGIQKTQAGRYTTSLAIAKELLAEIDKELPDA